MTRTGGMMKTCEIQDCTSSVVTRGKCSRHYQEWYRSLPKESPVAPTSLVAFTPEELPHAQSRVSDWCDDKISHLQDELKDVKENLKIAVERKWKVQGWRRQTSLCQRRIQFYEKVKDAVLAGYLIIPNFPIRAFAIRVHDTSAPAEMPSPYSWEAREQSSDRLAAGEGEYKSPLPAVASRDGDFDEKTQKYKTEWFANDFQDVAFPVVAVKPQVMDAAGRAMALKVFDEVGLVGPGRQKDPIVVGRIIDPRSTRWNEKVVTFFIAWWLNLEAF